MKQRINDLIKQLLRVKESGSFAQNVSIVFSGNFLNLLLQFGLAPIISRVYGPEAYGEYAYYNLIIGNIAFFAAFSLPTVYVLPKARIEYLSLAKVVIYSMLLAILFSLIALFFLNGSLFDFQGSKLAIPLVAAIILFSGLNNVFKAWNARQKNFRRNTSVDVLSNLSAKLFTLAAGYYWKPIGLGLLSGDGIRSISIFFTQTSLKVRLVILRFMLSISNWPEVWEILKKHLNVPKYVFPSQLISKWTADLPILVIGGYFGKEMLGYYTFALTMLNIPKSLIANSFQPVLYQKLNELYQAKSSRLQEFLTYGFLGAALIFILPITLISTFGEQLFGFFFGDEWTYSGKVMLVICTEVVVSTIMAPFGGIRRIFGFEKKILFMSFLSIIFKLAGLGLLVVFNFQLLDFLLIYASLNTVYLLINQFDILWHVIGKKRAFGILSFNLILIIIAIFIIQIFI